MKIEIYGKYNCTFCDRAQEACHQRNLDFTYKPLVSDKAYEAAASVENYSELMKRATEHNVRVTTVPQIFVDNKYVGGYDDFLTFLENNYSK